MKLLLFIILLHGGTMDADDVAHCRYHRQVVQTLGVDYYCRKCRHTVSFMMVGLVDHFDCADELSLRILVGVARINNHSEEVVVVMLLCAINTGVFKGRVDISTLYVRGS